MDQIIKEPQDLTYLSWTNIRQSSGTAGSFLKSQELTAEGKIYYKLSNYDAVNGITGHESVNEIIADRLLTLLGIPHVSYRLIHADIVIDGKTLRTWLCASYDFRKRGERKIPLDIYYDLNKLEGESPLDFCLRNGWGEYIWQMLLVDYLILNRDRHGANMEVLENRYIQPHIRLAPLFDHGLSFFCRTPGESALKKEDVMADKKIQCFVGSQSAWENLGLIPEEKRITLPPLTKSDKDHLIDGLDNALGRRWLERIVEMIEKRWKAYEDFLNQR